MSFKVGLNHKDFITMNYKNSKLFVLILGIICGISACGKSNKTSLANPASQHCIHKGGKFFIEKHKNGGDYGICLFEDGRMCEEWALYRGECPVGGRKTTGYLTSEGKFCALEGGDVLGNEERCHMPSGNNCSSLDVYEGRCR